MFADSVRATSAVTSASCFVARLAQDASACSFCKQPCVAEEADDSDVSAGDCDRFFPTDHALRGLGACTAMTLRLFGEAMHWDLGAISVAVTIVDKRCGPRIFRHVACRGKLDVAQRERLATVCEQTPWTVLLKCKLPIHTRML